MDLAQRRPEELELQPRPQLRGFDLIPTVRLIDWGILGKPVVYVLPRLGGHVAQNIMVR